MGHILDPWGDGVNPETLTPVLIGCINCGTTCPWTDETDPPLTNDLGDLWFEAHNQICTGAPRKWDRDE